MKKAAAVVAKALMFKSGFFITLILFAAPAFAEVFPLPIDGPSIVAEQAEERKISACKVDDDCTIVTDDICGKANAISKDYYPQWRERYLAMDRSLLSKLPPNFCDNVKMLPLHKARAECWQHKACVVRRK